MFTVFAKMDRWVLALFLAGVSAVAASAEQLPIGDGAYLSKEHCELAERGELDMVGFLVGKNGREVSFEETGCLVATIKPVRANRYDVELDCREVDVVYQHQLFLDVVNPNHIRVDGEDLLICKKGFLGGETSSSASVNSADNLIGAWEEANEGCSGGFGNDPATETACVRRTQLVEKLNHQGLCFGRKGQSRSQYEWHRCVQGSLQ